MKEIQLNVRKTTSNKKVYKNHCHQNNNYNNNTAINLKNGGGSKKDSLKLSTPKLKNSDMKTTKTNIMGSNHSSPKTSSKSNSPKKGKAGSNKQSQELRPRRRASQTYFFKYQLARNPLKAEEEDLKLALLASLQQCNNNSKTKLNKNSRKNNNGNKFKPCNNNDTKLYINGTKKCKKLTKINYAPERNKSSNITTSSSSSTMNSPHTSGNKSRDDMSELSSTTSFYTSPEPIESSIHHINQTNKPETEDFLSFICLRTTAPNDFSNDTSSNTIICTTPTKATKNELNNIRCITSPSKLFNYSCTHNHSPVSSIYNRRPIRQSPRLAISHQRKISENNDTSNTNITSTAYDNSIKYEEDLKRASIALEDMAQEISCTSVTNNNEDGQKHLVTGLISREFAGAFADEETIFESLSNHKL